jgi:hypothetical protein
MVITDVHTYMSNLKSLYDTDVISITVNTKYLDARQNMPMKQSICSCDTPVISWRLHAVHEQTLLHVRKAS